MRVYVEQILHSLKYIIAGRGGAAEVPKATCMLPTIVGGRSERSEKSQELRCGAVQVAKVGSNWCGCGHSVAVMVSRCRYAAVQVAKVKSHWCGCGHSVAVMVSRCWGRSSVPLSLPGTKESAFRKKAAAAFLINIFQHLSRDQ